MSTLNLPAHQWIADADQWQRCLQTLRQTQRFALDLESNGMFAYREQICLIQISICDADYIIDPLAGFDLSGLGELLADEQIEKVLHASEYDLILMQRECGWELRNLFDTMWAARVLGFAKTGLASMLRALYGLELSKKHQRADWCARPLTDEQLAYAQADTHFLLRMRDELADRLRACGRLQEAQEIFAEQSQPRLPDVDFSEDSFWSINGASKLNGRQRAILRELDIFRDGEARRRNRPPFKVLHNDVLLEIAKQAPRNQAELEQIKRLKNWQARRYGRQLLAAVARGKRAPAPKRPRPPRPEDEVLERFERLKQWRKERGVERGVPSDVVMARDGLWQIAKENPQSTAALADLNVLGSVRFALYADQIVALLNGQ